MAKAVTPLNQAATTQYFYPSNDLWRLENIRIAASSAMSVWTALWQEVSGSSPTWNAIKMPTTNANGQNFIGILAEPIASTDSDYATAGKIKQVWVPINQKAEAFFAVWAGTFTAADIGRVCQFHTDSVSLAVDTNWAGAVIVDYVSATKWICNFSVAKVVTA